MTTGLVLIAAILVLGGVIATVGDRIGMRVGKARLSLFKLRPRQTATLISILTGIIISATTFGILFAIDDQLRTGVFDLQQIQQEKRQAETERDVARRERQTARRERNAAQREQTEAEKRLTQINRSLRRSIAQQQQTETQLDRTQTQLQRVQDNFKRAQYLLQTVSQQATTLRSEIRQLQIDRQRQLAQSDREIAERDRAIASREGQLRELETQRAALASEVQELEQQVQDLTPLSQGNVVILRNQPLASAVVRNLRPSDAAQFVDELLRGANREAVRRILPDAVNANEQVIQITVAQVEQLTNRLKDGQEYVVSVLSSRNYVVGQPCVLAGESCVEVYVTAALNQVVFATGEVVSSTTVNPALLNNRQLLDRIYVLIGTSQFRARQAGIVGSTIQIADNRPETVFKFLEQVKQYNQAIDIQAVAAETTFTAGPLRLELVAVQNGQALFSTRNEPPRPE
ncbi:MAG TPA: DUF3084 domain-containing protein [Crinalium sp.]|jgi:uncharacterized protein (DUF3084 family)